MNSPGTPQAAAGAGPFLSALHGQPTRRRPIWIMRQAGRYLPEYRAVREKASFLDLCRDPELACEVTLQPIRRFGFDAAILFSDILLPLGPMGAPFAFTEQGPRLASPVRREEDVAALAVVPAAEELGFVAKAISLIKRELGPTPLIGFAGAPFTLAAYLVEGGGSQEFRHLKTMLFRRPDLARQLLEKLADQVADHLLLQVRAGVDAVQLFDTWAGILAPEDYERFALPSIRRIFSALAGAGVPRILFMKGCAPYLPVLAASGADVIGLDWTVDLGRALAQVGTLPVQGNLDPVVLFAEPAEIRRRASEICRAGDRAAGHVFNLGHGILPATDIAAVETLVETVHSHRPEPMP